MQRLLRWGTLMLLFALLWVSGGSATAEMQTDDGAPLMQEPVDVRLISTSGACVGEVGGTKIVNVMVYDVAELAGVEFGLSFDPQVLEVVDADPDRPGVQIETGAIFSGRQMYAAANTADNQAGTIHYGAAITMSGSPVAGTGSLGRITFRVKTKAAAQVTFDTEHSYLPRDVRLVPPQAPDIEAIWHDLTLYGVCYQLYLPRVSSR